MTAMLPALRKAAKQGRRGDDVIAHINPEERRVLEMIGGAGTRNPHTGLLEFYERADSRDRGPGTGNRGNSGGGDRTGNSGGGGRNNFPGYRGPIGTSNPDTSSAGVDDVGHGLVDTGKDTSWGTRIFENWGENPISQGITVARSPAWKQQADDYNQAAREWNDDLVQNNILGWALPFGMQNVAPRWDQPSTFAEGTYHFGFNPAAAAGGIAGMFMGPGGIIAGPAAGKAYDMAGGKNVVLSGPGAPDNDFTGGPKQSSSLSSGQPSNQGPSDRTGAAGGGVSMLPPIVGNPSAPSTPTVTPPVVPVSSGVGLPPIKAPVVQRVYRAIPGPSPYGAWIMRNAA